MNKGNNNNPSSNIPPPKNGNIDNDFSSKTNKLYLKFLIDF